VIAITSAKAMFRHAGPHQKGWRKRARAASVTASKIGLPAARNSRANSTIRIAFLAESLDDCEADLSAACGKVIAAIVKDADHPR